MRTRLILTACFAIVAGSAVTGQSRPTVGVAFGGGSARGIAHVGVIRWFEEHRIPIDLAAGTSMGGLIGGAFATGMGSGELATLLRTVNWDELFGASNFAFKNIRRKADARAYPSRLEFGTKGGIVPPSALNDGQQVDLLVGRIAAPYYGIETFDELPTPFRAVAVDLVSAKPVVLDRGPLAAAMRATMSLPLIFPPVLLEGRVLIDGGAMNNVPADVVRAMGATRVVAINVGNLDDLKKVDYSMFGLAGATLDAMIRANTTESLKQADIIINVPLEAYGSLDWRRSEELIEEGYKAAEAMRDRLLPLALSEAEYAAWKAARESRRRTSLPVPTFAQLEGFSPGDEAGLRHLLARHLGKAVDTGAIEADLAVLSGLDRYESITWRIVRNATAESGLLVSARQKPYGPPFLMLGVNLENTTSDAFKLSLTGRYLTYGIAGSRSELRIDATIGSDPSVATELYRPLGKGPVFVAPYAGVVSRTFNVIADDAIVAAYGRILSTVGANVGVNLGRVSDLRLGVYLGRRSAQVKVGAPGLPAATGKEAVAELSWRYNGQDSPVIPTAGTAAHTDLRYVLDTPDLTAPIEGDRSNVRLTQVSGEVNRFFTVRHHDRLFVLGAAGTSFSGKPLPTEQFLLGSPLHLGAYNAGEIRGDHFYVVTAGYFRQVGRLPDFMGGSILAGAWIENGDAFDTWRAATVRTNASAGMVMDTLVGPVVLATSVGFDGRWRLYLGVGRIFGQR